MKKYTITHYYLRGEIVSTGTIDELVQRFGYTLECGHSRSSRIQRYPRTAKALEKALNASALVCGRYNDSYYIREGEV